ncbi:hypothetical protein [Alteribacter natronophilus]|nr:hypothetical protein [Alteribacter natronophilus]
MEIMIKIGIMMSIRLNVYSNMIISPCFHYMETSPVNGTQPAESSNVTL